MLQINGLCRADLNVQQGSMVTCAFLTGTVWLLLGQGRISHSLTHRDSAKVLCHEGASAFVVGWASVVEGHAGVCRSGLDEEETWSQQGKTYEQWLCHLGDVLLDHCKDPLLRALQKVARKRPAMMELVMPQLFASLAVEGSTSGCLAQNLAPQVYSAKDVPQIFQLRCSVVVGVWRPDPPSRGM